MKVSVVWFALEMMGYDARLYSYQDWMANQPSKSYLGSCGERMILIKSDSCRAGHKGFSAIAKTMLIYGIISILLHGLVLSAPVLAGTETGEFCPTCPDWTDLEGWQAQKAAYDQEQQNIKLQVQQIAV